MAKSDRMALPAAAQLFESALPLATQPEAVRTGPKVVTILNHFDAETSCFVEHLRLNCMLT